VPDANDRAWDEGLRLRRDENERAVLIHAVGEVDHVGAPRLSAELADSGQAGQVVVDLTGVSFLGSAGVAVLVERHRHGGHVRIVAGNPTVRRTLERTGLLAALPVFDTLDDALAGTGSEGVPG
jgi:anti-anti-sigma factor